MFYNLFESYDYGKTFTILSGGVTSFALAKASYGLDNKDLSKNPDYLYISSTKQGVRYNRLKPTIYEPCGIGYHSSTGYGPLCVSCPLSSTNTFIGQTECTICRNGYFGINGEAPCHEYYGWLAYAIISMYTATVIIAAFLYSNKRTIQKKYTELKQMSKDIQERWASVTEEKSKGNAGDIEHTEHGNKVGEESKIVDSQEDGEDEDEEVDEEAEADDNNYNVDIIVASEVNIKAKNENIPKKHKAAPYEDLVLHAFVNDRRQTLRMRAPLANRQRPSSEENQGSLPPLHAETSRGFVHGTVAHNLLSRGGPGWRAPPRIEKKKIDRVPTQNQSEAAQRLSQGLSSSHNKNTTKRSINNEMRNLCIDFS